MKQAGNPNAFAHVRRELEERRSLLEEEMRQSNEEKVTDDQVQDPGDQTVSSTMETLKSSMQDSRLAEYNRITKAIEMLNEGTYGICVDCDGPISEKRLKSFPNSTRCISCQEAYEEQQRE